jgi:hypothetical protein
MMSFDGDDDGGRVEMACVLGCGPGSVLAPLTHSVNERRDGAMQPWRAQGLGAGVFLSRRKGCPGWEGGFV